MTTTTTTAASSVPVKTYADFGHPLWRRILVTREMAIIALLIAVLVVASIQLPRFATPITVTNLLLDVTPILLIALTMAPIMITGDIDLSVGSMVGLSSVVVGLLTHAGWSIPAAGLCAIVIGVGGGLVNGLLVTRFGLPALAVTIGTLALYRGMAIGLLGTTAITSFDRTWTKLAKSKIGETGIPTVMILFLVLLAIFVVLLHFTTFGRGVYAIGLSKDAAAFSGIHVARTRVTLFVLSGAMSALAGVFYTLRYTSSRGDNATGLELAVIAAVVLGGVSVFGGRGALHGVVAGVLLIGALSNALRLASVTSDVINIITGVLLVLSVIAGSLMQWIQSRRVRPATTAASA
jgi:rhamnose transport system permease protein